MLPLELCEVGPIVEAISIFLFDSSPVLNCLNTICILFTTALISDILSPKPRPVTLCTPELVASPCFSLTENRSALMLKVNVVPKPILDSTEISPCRLLHIFLQMERPRPTPLGFKCALNLRVQKSEKIFGNSVSGIPVPESFTEMKILPRCNCP